MDGAITQHYPGDTASAEDIADMADAYREAYTCLRAYRLERSKTSRSRISTAPSRLCAIHAIELYLNCYLRAHGVTNAQVRGMQHNLDRRLLMASEKGLALKGRTQLFLNQITGERDYLLSRYDPEGYKSGIALTALEAILEELESKVKAALSEAQAAA